MKKLAKTALSKQLALAGLLSVSALISHTQVQAATFYTADNSNTNTSIVGLAQGSLGNSTLSNPSIISAGGNNFNYAAVTFTPTESGTYSFGQTSSPADTVMILYNGIYDPTLPGSGALVGNDDTAASVHQAAIGSDVAVLCGPSTNYCPQVTYSVTAGITYTLFVSVYSPSYNNVFDIPFGFYSTGDVAFSQYTGRSPIDLARNNYMSSELGVTIDPVFVGGTLHMDQNNGLYTQDFTLANMATSTIDQNNQYSVFNGQFTDAAVGTPGQISIDNSGTEGAVVFNGINTYTGSTTLKGGTLVVSQDANLGDTVATLVFDGGTLQTTASFESNRQVDVASVGTLNVTGDTTLSLSGAVAGSGSLIKEGTGTLVLNAENTYSGNTDIRSGTLLVGDHTHTDATLSGGGDITVAAGAILGGYGSVTGSVTNNGEIMVGSVADTSDNNLNFRINGDVINNGLIQLDGTASGSKQLIITGNYVGNNALLSLNGKIGDDGSATDKLVIGGNATGSTKVSINNLGGVGAKTINGIEVIDVAGVSDNQAFTQAGRIVAGAYDYNLVKGNQSGTDTQSWFLKVAADDSQPNNNDDSRGIIRPEAGGYLGLINFNQGTFNHSFHDRQQLPDGTYQSAWSRIEYTHDQSKFGTTHPLSNKTERTILHFGSDVLAKEALHVGVMGAYSKGEVKTDSNHNMDHTKSDSDGYSVGVYGTWYDQDQEQKGLYVDSYAQYNWFENQVQGNTLSAEKFNTSGKTVSAEVGYGFALGQTGNTHWAIEPQIQAIYNSYDGKDHVEANGTHIRSHHSDDVTGRVGVRLQGKNESIQPFVTLSYWTHGNQASISMDDVNVKSDRTHDVAEIKVGGQVKINDHVQLFGQLQGSTGSDSSTGYGGNIGMKVNW